MFDKIIKLLGAEKYISPELLRKGLQKIDPRLKGYFSESEKYGYPIGAALGFLRSELTGQGEAPVNPNLRPDEAANIELKRQSEAPQQFLKKAANVVGGAALGGLGGTALAGAGLLPGILSGHGQEVSTQQAAQPQSPAQFLSQYDPNLANYIEQYLQQGQSPQQAAALAKHSGYFSKVLPKLERDVAQNFVDFLPKLYGQQQASAQPQRQQTPQQQQSNSDAQLLAAIDKLLKL